MLKLNITRFNKNSEAKAHFNQNSYWDGWFNIYFGQSFVHQYLLNCKSMWQHLAQQWSVSEFIKYVATHNMAHNSTTLVSFSLANLGSSFLTFSIAKRKLFLHFSIKRARDGCLLLRLPCCLTQRQNQTLWEVPILQHDKFAP